MLLDILDLVFCLSLLHKVQLILAVAGILSLKKFRTSKKSRSFLCLLTLIMKYEPYLGEKKFFNIRNNLTVVRDLTNNLYHKFIRRPRIKVMDKNKAIFVHMITEAVETTMEGSSIN